MNYHAATKAAARSRNEKSRPGVTLLGLIAGLWMAKWRILGLALLLYLLRGLA